MAWAGARSEPLPGAPTFSVTAVASPAVVPIFKTFCRRALLSFAVWNTPDSRRPSRSGSEEHVTKSSAETEFMKRDVVDTHIHWSSSPPGGLCLGEVQELPAHCPVSRCRLAPTSAGRQCHTAGLHGVGSGGPGPCTTSVSRDDVDAAAEQQPGGESRLLSLRHLRAESHVCWSSHARRGSTMWRCLKAGRVRMSWTQSDCLSLFSRTVFPRGVEAVTREFGECASGLAFHSAPCNPRLRALVMPPSTELSAVISLSLGVLGD